MKKNLIAAAIVALLVVCMAIPALAEGEIKIGQVQYAAHGTKCFAVLTVAMDGDKIAAAYIDEFQIMDSTATTPVPNAEAMFADKLGENMQLASKRVNSEFYSNNMTKAGSTVALDANYAAIEAYVAGKTVAELEAEIAGKEAAAVVDAVAGCTLVDTLGYINGILDAAKK